MRYATLAALLAGAADDQDVLAMTSALMTRYRAAGTVLSAAPLEIPLFAPMPAVAGGLLQAELWKSADDHRRNIVERTKHLVMEANTQIRAAGGGGDLVIAPSAPTPWLTIQREAPLADLVLVAASSARADGPWTGLLGDVMMSARVPILVVRGGAPVWGGRVAIAWDGSFEAGRAVRAAQPLLHDAHKVTILQNPRTLDVSEGAAANVSRLSRYLETLGVRDLAVTQVDGEATGPSLLGAALDAGATTLVAGAFGHARLKEAVLGGATRSFLAADEGPHLFLCH